MEDMKEFVAYCRIFCSLCLKMPEKETRKGRCFVNCELFA